MKKVLALSGMMLIAGQAMAFDVPPEGNVYLGAGVGQASFDSDFLDDVDDVPGVSVDDKDTAYTIFGGYRVNPYFSLELGFVNFGEAKADVSGFGEVASFEVKGTSLSVLGRLPIDSGLSLIGRVGGIYWDGEAHVLGESEDADGTDPLFGAGLEYGNGAYFARAEYTRYLLTVDVEDADDEDVDIDMWALSAGFNF